MHRLALLTALAGSLIALPAAAEPNQLRDRETATIWKVDYSGRPPYDRELVEVPVADAASFEAAVDMELQRVWHTDFSGRPPFKRGYVEMPVIDAARLELDLGASPKDAVRPRPFAKPRHR